MKLTPQELDALLRRFKRIRFAMYGLIALFCLFAWLLTHPPQWQTQTKPLEISEAPEIENGVHLESGLIAKGDFELVVNHCGGCHGHQLVIQNKNTRAGWHELIDWMQATQGLWDLGEQEEAIVNYLATYYAPQGSGRRKNLENIEWYELN